MTTPDATPAPGTAALDSDDAPAIVAVVDDDVAVRTLVERVLAGYQVHSFERPRDALRAFTQGLRPQLIISDVQMPGMDGFTLHAEVRRLASLRGVPFVYLTALDDHASLRRGMGQGADDYLTKPFTPDELRQAVAVRLERQAALSHAPPAALDLSTLGGVSIAVGDVRLTWEARRAVVLFAYLLDHGGRVSAERVRRELWSDPVADNHLHVLVSRLRKTLAEFARVSVAGDQVALETTLEVRWDVTRFEAAAAAALAPDAASDAAVLEQAISVYGGTFLPGFDGPWVELRRSAVEDRYVALLETAVERSEAGPRRERACARYQAFLELG